MNLGALIKEAINLSDSMLLVYYNRVVCNFHGDFDITDVMEVDYKISDLVYELSDFTINDPELRITVDTVKDVILVNIF